MPSQQLPLVNQREPLPPLMHFSLRFFLRVPSLPSFFSWLFPAPSSFFSPSTSTHRFFSPRPLFFFFQVLHTFFSLDSRYIVSSFLLFSPSSLTFTSRSLLNSRFCLRFSYFLVSRSFHRIFDARRSLRRRSLLRFYSLSCSPVLSIPTSFLRRGGQAR